MFQYSSLHLILNITKTRLFKYIENFTSKNWNFSDKNFSIFHISAQNKQSLIPPIIQNTTTYNLRNSSDLRNVHARTNLFYNSFIPATICVWNDLSDEIKTAPSVASFKYRLNNTLKKPPKYYNTGSRIGQILLARLRMECSSLNAHLYRENIVPSPTCSCGGFESTYHFFFQCSTMQSPEEGIFRTIFLPWTLIRLFVV